MHMLTLNHLITGSLTCCKFKHHHHSHYCPDCILPHWLHEIQQGNQCQRQTNFQRMNDSSRVLSPNLPYLLPHNLWQSFHLLRGHSSMRSWLHVNASFTASLAFSHGWGKRTNLRPQQDACFIEKQKIPSSWTPSPIVTYHVCIYKLSFTILAPEMDSWAMKSSWFP